jgi:hypothetical protein
MRAAGIAVLLLGAWGCYSGGSNNTPGDDASTDGVDAGCIHGSLPSSCPTPPPSYQTDVEPILNTYCNICHYTNSTIAKGDFTTYAGVYNYRGACLDQIYGCAMPPVTSIQLNAADRQTLLAWFVCSAPDN